MRIGLLTCHSCLNYGANLQLYATVKSLKKMGHDVFVFDNRDYEPGVMRDFVETHTTLTHPCRTDDDFRQETLRLKLDVLLVGSDAVLWFLPGKEGGRGAYPNPFWLRWARDLPVRKGLIAGSCMGVLFRLKCRGALRRQLRDDLSAFNYISVRDQWTKSFVDWLGVKGAELTFDPTSCLPGIHQPDSAQLPIGLEPGKYLLLTFTNTIGIEHWVDEMTRAAHERGLKTCFIPHPDRRCKVTSIDYIISEILDPLIWLSILTHSAGYVGERFHPVVLSSFYGIPFLSSDYYSRSGPAGLLNGRSKTRDFCKRIGALSDVIPADSFFSRREQGTVLNRLLEGHSVDVTACHSMFQNALNDALKA